MANAASVEIEAGNRNITPVPNVERIRVPVRGIPPYCLDGVVCWSAAGRVILYDSRSDTIIPSAGRCRGISARRQRHPVLPQNPAVPGCLIDTTGRAGPAGDGGGHVDCRIGPRSIRVGDRVAARAAGRSHN